MLEGMNSDYIRTARAKGLTETKVIYKHAFRNTMIPLVTSLAGLIPSLFSGAMITEQVFNLTGIGNYALTAMTQGDIPVIMITAKGESFDKLQSFELGVDDYIVKPYTIRNVIARVKSVLRRTANHKSHTPIEKPNILRVEGLQLDLEFKRCTIDGTEVKLTRKEYELLAYLLSHRGQICSREQILNRVWSDEVVVLDRTIDVNITRLRSKIGAYGTYIVTRSGFGYGFRD